MDKGAAANAPTAPSAIKEAARPFISTANNEDPIPAKDFVWPAETKIIRSHRKWRLPPAHAETTSRLGDEVVIIIPMRKHDGTVRATRRVGHALTPAVASRARPRLDPTDGR